MPNQTHACKQIQCSHICLLAHNSSYTCECPENMELKADKHTCRDNEKAYSMIMGIGGKYLVSVPHQTFGRHRDSIGDNIEHNIDQMAFNSQNGEVLIADNTAGKILTVDTKKGAIFDVVNKFLFNVSSLSYGEPIQC